MNSASANLEAQDDNVALLALLVATHRATAENYSAKNASTIGRCPPSNADDEVSKLLTEFDRILNLLK